MKTRYLYEKHIHLNRKKSVNKTDLMIEDIKIPVKSLNTQTYSKVDVFVLIL